MWVKRLLSEVIQTKSVGFFRIDFTHQEMFSTFVHFRSVSDLCYLGVKAVWKTLSQIYLAKMVKPHTSQQNVFNSRTLFFVMQV